MLKLLFSVYILNPGCIFEFILSGLKVLDVWNCVTVRRVAKGQRSRRLEPVCRGGGGATVCRARPILTGIMGVLNFCMHDQWG